MISRIILLDENDIFETLNSSKVISRKISLVVNDSFWDYEFGESDFT